MHEAMSIQRLRGTADILPDEAPLWRRIESAARREARLYGCREIRTPVFERTELFSRSVGETTDIVSREMYTFPDRGGRSVTLRPEGTAPVVRAYLENALHRTAREARLYYLGPIFRYEKPQAGRQRQHHQFGVEAFGDGGPAIDAEVIELLMRFYEELGMRDLSLLVNTVGCAACRPAFNGRLAAFLASRRPDICEDCRRRSDGNPLRVFDCKSAGCAAVIAEAPRAIESVCPACRVHFDGLRALLDEAGIAHTVRPELVRGIDYYTRTAFEVLAGGLGAQNAVGGGGRYDDLVESLGGPPTPAVGFGTGIERIVMVMAAQGIAAPPPDGAVVSVIAWEPEGIAAGRRALRSLRGAGIPAEMDHRGGSLRSQLRRAHRAAAAYALLVGAAECARGAARLKDMRTGEEREVPLEGIGAAMGRLAPAENRTGVPGGRRPS
ncbi:MAG: histidine--tRNA ligase [bacterium]|nr:histidine--tRNA ligase [bacterium]